MRLHAIAICCDGAKHCSRAPGPRQSPCMMAAGSELQAEAFQRLYPDQYFAKFIEQSVRPDGRRLAVARQTSIGLGVVHTADSSALVKVGSTTVLAGIKCEVMPASADTPDQGRLTVQVEMSRLCSADTRPGRPSEAAQALTEQLSSLLDSAAVVDCRQLCIEAGRAAWAVYADLYVLDADGSLHDACLLALLAALSSLRLQTVTVDESGAIHRADGDAGAADAAGQQQQQQAGGGGRQLRRLELGCLPVSLTCGVYRGQLLVDPTAEEEPMLEALMTATLDGSGSVLGFYKAGGTAASQQQLLECLEAARLRGEEVRGMLQQAVEQAEAAAAAAAGAAS